MIPVKETNVRNTDRILILKPKEGEKVLSSTGLTDPRLFSGENKLHALKDLKSNLWSFKYEMGGLPESLKQKYTTFDRALQAAKNYFLRRNVDIVDVVD